MIANVMWFGGGLVSGVVATLVALVVRKYLKNKNIASQIEDILNNDEQTQCLFDVVNTIFKTRIEFVADVLGWALNLVERCMDKIQEGWRMYYVEVDVEQISPHIIPRDRLAGAKKVSLGIMTDKNMNPKKVDRAFVHNEVDDKLAAQLGGKGVVEITL